MIHAMMGENIEVDCTLPPWGDYLNEIYIAHKSSTFPAVFCICYSGGGTGSVHPGSSEGLLE